MSGAVKIDLKGFEELSKDLEKINGEVQWFIAELANEIAARLLRKVIKRTPVGVYGKQIPVTKKIYRYEVVHGETTKNGNSKKKRIDTGKTKIVMQNVSSKMGGTLRKGWTVGTVIKSGKQYNVEVINSIEYASYVEFGHRTRNHKGWVPGQYMLTISEEEMKNDLERIIQNKLKEKFGIK